MLTAKQVRFWYRTHKWTSLVCTTFLLMSCLTGLPMIFKDEIDHLTDHSAKAAVLPASAPFADMDSIVRSGRQRYPELKALFLVWDEDEPRIFLNMGPSFVIKPGSIHRLVFDAHTGKLLEADGQTGDFMDYVEMLHVHMYAGVPGEACLGVMALVFVVALVSGAVVYGPFMRRLNFGTVRKDKSARVRWFDLHNLIGIVTLSWALVVGATGVMNTLSGPLFDLWSRQVMPLLLSPYRGKPLPEHFASANAAVHTAKAALPDMQFVSLIFPNDVFGSPRHYLIWTHGKTPVTSRLFTPVLIDAQTGKLSAATGLPWYLRALEMSRPLHFGDYGGMPLKILWAGFDITLIVVLVSGLYLWFSRRKTSVEAELDRMVELEEKETAA